MPRNHWPWFAKVLSASKGTGRSWCITLHGPHRLSHQKPGLLLPDADLPERCWVLPCKYAVEELYFSTTGMKIFLNFRLELVISEINLILMRKFLRKMWGVKMISHQLQHDVKLLNKEYRIEYGRGVILKEKWSTCNLHPSLFTRIIKIRIIFISPCWTHFY